jgi:hypothetical protein
MCEIPYAFQRDHPVDTFPATARFYQWSETLGRPQLQSRVLHSRQEWRQFQQECTEREEAGEWVFGGYYVLDLSA